MIICEICDRQVQKIKGQHFPVIWIAGEAYEVCQICHSALTEEFKKIFEKARREWPKNEEGIFYIK